MTTVDTDAAASVGDATRAWPMVRALVGVGLLCGLLIVGAFEVTAPIIARNRAEALQRAIFQVLPSATSSRTFVMDADGAFAAVAGQRAADARAVHAGFDDDGELVGLAIEAQGMGYQDVIGVLYGYSFTEDAIIGVAVLESRETPGLGTKIETDPDFLRNFERLDVSLTEDGRGILHPIEAVKHGEKQSPWQVDAITGATISSYALADILRESSAFWMPRVEARIDDFEAE